MIFVALPIFLILDGQQSLLRIFIVSNLCFCNTIVPVEVIVIVEISFDGVQEHQHIFKLLYKEKAGCHALSPGNGVALRSGRSNKLKELLSTFQLCWRISPLTDACVNNGLRYPKQWIAVRGIQFTGSH